MSLKVEDVGPPPHLFSGRSATWPSSYTSQACSLGSSPALKSPEQPHTYSRMHENPMSSRNTINSLPTTGWYEPSISANDFQYTGYEQYNPPRSSEVLSPHSSTYRHGSQVSSLTAPTDSSARVISPVPVYPHSSLLSETAQQSVELQQASDVASQRSPNHAKVESHGQPPSHGTFSVLQPVPSPSAWSIDSLGIHTPSLQSDSYFANFTQHQRGLRSGEGSIEMALTAPQPRRVFTPIAPQPIDTPRSMAAKRSRDDDESAELSKRRRRSESTNSTQLELTEEDKLLLRLKEEELMPWKDIAARFQNDLGKQYQIPALQMRLKRLRERMRVWGEADVRALRMAHEYWAQNKFDIISQKMAKFGAQDKWTARQCARKWAENDALPAAMPQHDQHAQHTFTPYSMSPAEPTTTFLPYMHS
ncbi:uncharacterized protein M421DRAFT_3630 [Didymella exigua CBS 183.55]|uniref:Uncharacterized protein n=1 Tax=Didymella exigua CBS 183.55 TaxID=1150837 RepID=A0A6A5RT07_9PLEO|nr:uncharacterized protein M421DRAFT_3630 [Didymella exigua CBS 183.55]KAF1930593.1 hypothetical protein M421DRAFT_3630 [Didymella exigua CBS 183.55]